MKYQELVVIGAVAFKGGSGSGGGGNSGKVEWPAYIQNIHERMLNTGVTFNGNISMEDAIYDAWDNSPYAGAVTYDPTTDLADVITRFDEMDARVLAISPATDIDTYIGAAKTTWEADLAYASEVTAALADFDWDTAVDAAETKAGEIISDDTINTRINEFDSAQATILQRNIARMAGSMADINAVNSSGFAMAIAAMCQDHARGVAEFGASLRREAYKDKLQFIQWGTDALQVQGVRRADIRMQSRGTKIREILAISQDIARHFTIKIDKDYQAAHLHSELRRVGIIAQREYREADLEYSVRDHKWNLELFQDASPLIASISGAIGPLHEPPNRPSTLGGGTAGALGGAMGGASLGLGAASAMSLIGAGNIWNPVGWAMILGGAALGGGLGSM